ncbi:MAG: hypothetical protein IKT58_06410 [Oscillospiraceae bacterium]|nr:hypothetical protein [Oscillospiraceae bacterium]
MKKSIVVGIVFCLSSYELRTLGIIPTALSVAFGDSSPIGGAKGLCEL